MIYFVIETELQLNIYTVLLVVTFLIRLQFAIYKQLTVYFVRIIMTYFASLFFSFFDNGGS